MYLMFPVVWNFGDRPSDGGGGAPVTDGDQLYVCLDEGEILLKDGEIIGVGDNDDVPCKISIARLAGEIIEGYASFKTGRIDDAEHIRSTRAVSAALKAAAHRLDAAIDDAQALVAVDNLDTPHSGEEVVPRPAPQKQ